MKGRLSDVQRNAVTLCLLHGYTRPEAARMLGIDPVAFGKVMDRATKKISGVVAAMDGRGCGDDEWARALRSFALGVIGEDSPDYERVAAHVRDCASCERYVVGLRGLAAVLPPLGFPLAPVGHDAGDLLAHLYRLFAPHNVAAAGAASAQTTATIATSTAAGSAVATGSGGWTVLGGGVAKVAVVVGLATVGTLSVHALATHRPARHARAVDSRPLISGTPLEEERVIRQAAPVQREQGITSEPSQRPSSARQGGPGVVRSEAAVAEFGFERSPDTTRHPQTPRPVARTATADNATSARSGVEPAEANKSPEFGLASHAASARSMSVQAVAASQSPEFGFER